MATPATWATRQTGSITYEFETKTFKYDWGIRLLVDIMDVEETDMLDRLVAAHSELQRMQVESEAEDFSDAEAVSGAAPTDLMGRTSASRGVR